MTTYFQSDFETGIGSLPPGWANASGAGMLVLKPTDFGKTNIAGLAALGRQNTGDQANYTASGPLGNQAVVGAGKLDSLGISFVLRSDSTGANAYRALIGVDGTGKLTATLARYTTGTTVLASATTTAVPASSDIIRYEAYAVGSTLSMYAWINGTTKPSAPTVTATDTMYATGYPGVIQAGANGSFCFVDNVVITDGAGGENAFYSGAALASGATLTGTDTLTGGTASGSGAGSASGATLTGTDTLTGGAASGVVAGTLTTKPFKQNNTALYANLSLTLNIYDATTGALVLHKTGLTTNSSGVVTVTDPAITTGTSYAYEPVFASGARRLPVGTAT